MKKSARFLQSSHHCFITPPQTEGPFYPLEFPIDQDTDLTYVTGHQGDALGEKIRIIGRILTPDCQPITNARVEIWQACASGRYRHEYDGNSAPVDPNFQYWGYAMTQQNGQYAFTTVKPGGYPVTRDWQRPPHIHFKVIAPSLPPLITQLYFEEEQELNQGDRILQRIPIEQRSLVTTKLKTDPKDSRRVGQFDIILGQSEVKKVTPHLDSHQS
ncbi:protocatechuate 3,4-dioxygenase [Chroococcus sp. FPU101]|uniref:dioxygenase family protein n=1 Tax=Chroococcus sp. FPU101 TaxID=1974212 RepID=UPI001AA806C7|nr:protocatechuate 3,4-dioxygenase [Chroococcus sp. FPU101]GFE69927.1 intradiol ring-cleavage dioxygenase [Chroococcus sp. FPU101]